MSYSKTVMEHFMNPRNIGEMSDADAVGEVGDAKCGNRMKFFMKVKDGIISDISFKTFGCGASIAASSIVTEMVKGKSLEKALALSADDVTIALDGLPEEKLHCSADAVHALQETIGNYKP